MSKSVKSQKAAEEWFVHGCKMFFKGESYLAIEHFSKAICFNPNDAPAYNNRGIARRELKDFEGAIEDYNEAIRLDSNLALKNFT